MFAQRSRHQIAAVRQCANADRKVDALLAQVHGAIAELQIQRQRRMLPRQLKQDRCDAQVAEQYRQGHAQTTGNLGAPALERGLACTDFLQRAQAMLVVERPGLGQLLAACGAQEQRGAEPRLQPRNALGHRRAGDLQRVGRLREVAEHVDTVQIAQGHNVSNQEPM